MDITTADSRFLKAKADVMNGILTLKEAANLYDISKGALVEYIVETNEYERIQRNETEN